MASLYDFLGNILTADQMPPTPPCPQPTMLSNNSSLATVAPPLFPYNEFLQNSYAVWNLSGRINIGGFNADVRVPVAQLWLGISAPPFANYWSATAPYRGAVAVPSPVGGSFGSGYGIPSIAVTLRLASPTGFANNFLSDTLNVNVICFWNGSNAWSGIAVMGAQETWPSNVAPIPNSDPYVLALPKAGGWNAPDPLFWTARINNTTNPDPLYSDVPPRLLLIGVNVQAQSTGLSPYIWTYSPLTNSGSQAPQSYLSWGVKILEIQNLNYPEQKILAQSDFFFPSDTHLSFVPATSPLTPLGNQGTVFEYSHFDSITQPPGGIGIILESPYSIPADTDGYTNGFPDATKIVFSPTLTAARLLNNNLTSYTVQAGALNHPSYQRPNLIVPNDNPMPLIKLTMPAGMMPSVLAGAHESDLFATGFVPIGAPALLWAFPANVPCPVLDSLGGQMVGGLNPIYPPLYDIVPNGRYSQNQRIVRTDFILIFAYQPIGVAFNPFYYQTYYAVNVNVPEIKFDPTIPGAIGNWVGPHIEVQMSGENNYSLYLQ